MHIPDDRHWKVPSAQPVFFAVQSSENVEIFAASHSQILSTLQYVYGSDNLHWLSDSHFCPNDIPRFSNSARCIFSMESGGIQNNIQNNCKIYTSGLLLKNSTHVCRL